MTTTLNILASFNGVDGEAEMGSLIADAAGNLYGTTSGGGAYGFGTVFEIAKTAKGYATTPITLVSFNGPDGQFPQGSLTLDAAGDLFGTTSHGGANYVATSNSNFVGSGSGTLFEISKTAGGYATTPTTLVSFDGNNGSQPSGGLIADAAGNLYGVTEQGGNSPGTVFEVAKTATGYAAAPITVANFNQTNFYTPQGSLIFDAAGDLLGTTFLGAGTSLHGAVFEIAKTSSGYGSTPTLLSGFGASYGAYAGAYEVNPAMDLIADAAGNLFGTTEGGGASGQGTVFEIAKTANGYAATPTILASFTGGSPKGALIADAAGNLYGTTTNGGTYGYGSVFELAKTAGGYASQPTTLISFNLKNGLYPQASLLADADGNLIGTTYYGGSYGAPDGYGTVFEITGTGFVSSGSSPLSVAALLAESRSGQLTSATPISDTAANVQSNLDAIEAVAVSSIALTDSSPPTLSITAAQLSADAGALNDISSGYGLLVAAGTAAVSIAGLSGHATTVTFTGDASQYAIGTANGALTVTSGGVTDTLSNISAIRFADVTEIVATLPGPASAVTTGNVTELYAAVLAREPDVGGLIYYQTYLLKNPATPLQQYAEWFLSSPEYTSAHNYAQSTAGDTQFIEDSYQNLLHRTPSAAEVSFYETNVLAPAVANLTPGTTAYADAQLKAHALMLVYFSVSSEFLSDVQVTAANPASAQHWLVLI